MKGPYLYALLIGLVVAVLAYVIYVHNEGFATQFYKQFPKDACPNSVVLEAVKVVKSKSGDKEESEFACYGSPQGGIFNVDAVFSNKKVKRVKMYLPKGFFAAAFSDTEGKGAPIKSLPDATSKDPTVAEMAPMVKSVVVKVDPSYVAPEKVKSKVFDRAEQEAPAKKKVSKEIEKAIEADPAILKKLKAEIQAKADAKAEAKAAAGATRSAAKAMADKMAVEEAKAAVAAAAKAKEVKPAPKANVGELKKGGAEAATAPVTTVKPTPPAKPTGPAPATGAVGTEKVYRSPPRCTDSAVLTFTYKDGSVLYACYGNGITDLSKAITAGFTSVAVTIPKGAELVLYSGAGGTGNKVMALPYVSGGKTLHTEVLSNKTFKSVMYNLKPAAPKVIPATAKPALPTAGPAAPPKPKTDLSEKQLAAIQTLKPSAALCSAAFASSAGKSQEMLPTQASFMPSLNSCKQYYSVQFR